MATPLEEQVPAWIKTVGAPHSHWIGHDTWIPAQGSRLYTPAEMATLFARKRTVFVGDSLQRRAANTLRLMLEAALPTGSGEGGEQQQNHDVAEGVFTDKYFLGKHNHHDRGYKEYTIADPTNNETEGGCLSIDWRPKLDDVITFATEFANSTKLSKHDVVVVGAVAWEVQSRARRSAVDVRRDIHETIHALHEHKPPDVLVIWKSGGWCANCPWAGSETARGRGDNYRIYVANDEAQKVIADLANPNFIYLDWGREILPRSIGNLRLASNDGNKYHYGLQARLQFLQMLTEVYDHQDPSVLAPPAGALLRPHHAKLEVESELAIFGFVAPIHSLCVCQLVLLFFLAVRQKAAKSIDYRLCCLL